MICLRNICINTLYKGDNDDDNDDDNNNNNNNNNNKVLFFFCSWKTKAKIKFPC